MDGAAGTLWHSNFKINTATRGYNLKFHHVGVDFAPIKLLAIDIAARLKKLMPTDAEIVYATLNNDNTKKDGRFIRGALGPGEYAVGGPPAVAQLYDTSWTCLEVRMENGEGDAVVRKIGPIPDAVLSSEELVAAVTDFEAPGVGALPAAGAGADWYAEFTNFMRCLGEKTHHVRSNHAPGAAFTYFPWAACYYVRVGRKKGGRVFI